MKEISILINNESRKVSIVRYFSFKENKYCIYTFNEIDPQGYKTLYVVKVVNSDSVLIGSGIIENAEWVSFVEQIKEVIKNNKESKDLAIEDLDYNDLTGFPINDGRPFKLKSDLTDLLNARMKSFDKETLPPPVEPLDKPNIVLSNKEQYDYLLPHELGVVEESSEDLNYQKLYEEEKAYNDQLLIEIGQYKQKLASIKEIID